jgi:hypothetical protein
MSNTRILFLVAVFCIATFGGMSFVSIQSAQHASLAFSELKESYFQLAETTNTLAKEICRDQNKGITIKSQPLDVVLYCPSINATKAVEFASMEIVTKKITRNKK